MLRLIANIVLLAIIVRLLQPLWRGVQRAFTAPKEPHKGPEGHTEDPYSELTPYDIEDADYEEIKGEK